MTTAKLVLLRHGQTEDNVRHLLTGHNDVPLTKLGEEEASAAGVLIKDIPLDKVYSSPLSRAFNTASLALDAAGQKVPVEKRNELIEADAGEFTGKSMDDPEFKNFTPMYGVALAGGESDEQIIARVQKFVDEEVLPRLARGENVLVVSHSGTTRAFDFALGLYPPPVDGSFWTKRQVPNATPIVYDYEDGKITPAAANRNAAPARKARSAISSGPKQ